MPDNKFEGVLSVTGTAAHFGEVRIDGDVPGIGLQHPTTRTYTVHLQGDNASVLLAEPTTTHYTVALNGTSGGELHLNTRNGVETIELNGEFGYTILGGNGANGFFVVHDKDSNRNDSSRASIQLDTKDGGDILLRPKNSRSASIHLDGSAGDIKLYNADCAEEFDMATAEIVEPGTVMVIDETAGVKQSTEAYDKKVAGVVSGAGNLKPALILDKRDEWANRIALSLMGKTYCKVDAQYAPIEVGDLLTTSPTAGHAMKAVDPKKAFGAIIGKALKAVDTGVGLVPILITLQ